MTTLTTTLQMSTLIERLMEVINAGDWDPHLTGSQLILHADKNYDTSLVCTLYQQADDDHYLDPDVEVGQVRLDLIFIPTQGA